MATDKELTDATREQVALAVSLLKPLQAKRADQRKRTEDEIDRLDAELDTLREKEDNLRDSLWFLEGVDDLLDIYEEFGADEEDKEHLSSLRAKVSGILELVNK